MLYPTATTQVIGPVSYPVSLAQVKKDRRITGSTFDVPLRAYILMATQVAEQYTARRLVTQTVKVFYDSWDNFKLPFGRLQSVTHVKYTDSAGDQATWDSGEYIVDINSDPGRVVLGYEKSFPTATLYPVNPIEIQYVCGYYQGDLWAVDTEYAENALVVPITENGLAYRCSTAGTSHATDEPTWGTTIGGTTPDGTAVWTCLGLAVPSNIKNAILLRLGDLFEIKEDIIVGTISSSLDRGNGLMYPFRLWDFIV